MRFSALIVGVLATLAAAQTTPTAPASPSGTLDAAQAFVLACLKTCSDSDVNCRAKCVGVPFPNTDQANATVACAAACPLSSGTEADNLRWDQCVAACIGANYWTSSGGTPQTTGLAGAGSGSGSNSGVTGASTTPTTAGGQNPTGTGAGTNQATTTTSRAGGEAIRVGSSAFGLLGFLAAVMAF